MAGNPSNVADAPQFPVLPERAREDTQTHTHTTTLPNTLVIKIWSLQTPVARGDHRSITSLACGATEYPHRLRVRTKLRCVCVVWPGARPYIRK